MPTHYRGAATERCALDALIKLTRARNAVTRALQRELETASRGITLSQFGIVEAILHLGPLCQKDLATKLLTSPANVTLLVDGLIRRDWVRRKRSTKDRRFSTVHLTAHGRAEVARLFPGHAARVAELFAVLTRAEQETLGTLCRKLGRAAAGAPTAGPAEASVRRS